MESDGGRYVSTPTATAAEPSSGRRTTQEAKASSRKAAGMHNRLDRVIPNPKADGRQRPLGIPTIRDRALQAMVKNALEPAWEARFEATSYGFRPGRSCHDAVVRVHLAANAQTRTEWVVDADIEGAFDHID